jgi:hypothetical protein
MNLFKIITIKSSGTYSHDDERITFFFVKPKKDFASESGAMIWLCKIMELLRDVNESSSNEALHFTTHHSAVKASSSSIAQDGKGEIYEVSYTYKHKNSKE